jgi:hypothetical protein
MALTGPPFSKGGLLGPAGPSVYNCQVRRGNSASLVHHYDMNTRPFTVYDTQVGSTVKVFCLEGLIVSNISVPRVEAQL